MKRRKSCLSSKSLVKCTVPEKISGMKYRNQAKSDRTKRLWYLLLHNFWLLWPKFYFWKEEWGLGSVSTHFEIFLIFPSFLRSKVFRRLPTCEGKFIVPDIRFFWKIINFQEKRHHQTNRRAFNWELFDINQSCEIVIVYIKILSLELV